MLMNDLAMWKKKPTFAAYLPKGNYNFDSGVFLRDEVTPHFVTPEMAKTNALADNNPNILRIFWGKKSRKPR